MGGRILERSTLRDFRRFLSRFVSAFVSARKCGPRVGRRLEAAADRFQPRPRRRPEAAQRRRRRLRWQTMRNVSPVGLSEMSKWHCCAPANRSPAAHSAAPANRLNGSGSGGGGAGKWARQLMANDDARRSVAWSGAAAAVAADHFAGLFAFNLRSPRHQNDTRRFRLRSAALEMSEKERKRFISLGHTKLLRVLPRQREIREETFPRWRNKLTTVVVDVGCVQRSACERSHSSPVAFAREHILRRIRIHRPSRSATPGASDEPKSSANFCPANRDRLVS